MRHLAKYPVKRSAILPLMFIVQRERGYLDPPGVHTWRIVWSCEITDIWEVATFYSMLQTKPVGKYHIQICKTLSCKIMGEGKDHRTRLQQARHQAGRDIRPTASSPLSLVECLGSCGTAPMFQIEF